MVKDSRRVSIRAGITLGFGVILVLLAAIGAGTTLSVIDATQLWRTFSTRASLSADRTIGSVRDGAETIVSAAEQSRAAAEALSAEARRLEDEVCAFRHRVRAA